jgi:hypothetical protein
LAEPVINKYHADSSVLEMWLLTIAMMAAMWNLFNGFSGYRTRHWKTLAESRTPCG